MFFFCKPPKPTTVDEAIAPLLKAVTDLDTIADSMTKQCARNEVHIAALQARIAMDGAEAARAMAVAGTIRAITNPKE